MSVQIKQWHQQAIDFINVGAYVKAHPLLVQIIKADAKHADAHFLLGVINGELGQFAKAAALIENACALNPTQEYVAQLIKMVAMVGDRERALLLASRCPANQVGQALAADTIGVALSRLGQHKEALAYYQKALNLDNSNKHFYYNYGVAAKFMADFGAASNAFEKAIELDPRYVKAHYALAEVAKSEGAKDRILRLESIKPQLTESESLLHIGHALAKEYESRKDYSSAFKALESGKAKALEQSRYHVTDVDRLFEQLHAKLSERTSLASVVPSSDRPIFVVGMPRSGTTLMDRVLSGHSAVASAEELHDFPLACKEVSQDRSPALVSAELISNVYGSDIEAIGHRYLERTKLFGEKDGRFIDKLPFNFLYLDVIRQALPQAKIVCMLRDPMDTCVGNYRQLFSTTNPFTGYSLSLEHTAHFYSLFHQWVHAFAAIYPDNICLVQYESLAKSPESEVQRVLEYCKLPWEPECLAVENNTAPVTTASKVQVREPINTKSIGRWKRYQPHTESLERFFTEQGIAYDL